VRKQPIERGEESRAEWETLEAFPRQGVQRLLQQVLEEEVDELLTTSSELSPTRICTFTP
jgi:hypothetical protein